MAHNSTDRETHDIDEPETIDIVDDPTLDNDSDRDDDHEEQPKSKKGKYIMYGGIAVLAGVLGVTAMQMFGGSSEAPAPAPKPQPAPIAQQQETPTPAPAPEATQEANVPAAPVPNEQASNVNTTENAPVSQGVTLPPAQNGEQVLPDLNQNVNNGNPNEIKGITPEEAPSSAPDLNSATVPSMDAPSAPVSPSVPAPQTEAVSTPETVQSPTAPAPAQAQPESAAANTAAPSLDSSESDTGVAPIAPIGGSSSVPATSATPALSAEASDDLNDSIKLLIKKMDGLSDSMDNLSEAVKDTNTRIDNTDKKVDELTKRVEKLEGKLSSTTVVPTTSVSKKDAVKKAPVVKRKRTQSYSNSVELSSSSSKRTTHVKKSYAPKRTSEASSRLGNGYTLQSVVTDRAWVKRSDGTMATYGIGDRMPNGKVVGSIDPDNGVFDTNGKLIIK